MRDFKADRLKFVPCAEGVAVICQGNETKTESGLYIPVGENEKFPATGKIVSLSKEAGEAGYEIDDLILYNNYLAEDVRIDGTSVDILLIHNVLGKILL